MTDALVRIEYLPSFWINDCHINIFKRHHYRILCLMVQIFFLANVYFPKFFLQPLVLHFLQFALMILLQNRICQNWENTAQFGNYSHQLVNEYHLERKLQKRQPKLRVFLGKGSVSCDSTNLFTLNVTLQTLYKQIVIVCLFGNRILTVHSNLRATIISLFLSIPSLSLYQHNYTVERRGQIERDIATLCSVRYATNREKILLTII